MREVHHSNRLIMFFTLLCRALHKVSDLEEMKDNSILNGQKFTLVSSTSETPNTFHHNLIRRLDIALGEDAGTSTTIVYVCFCI